MLFLPKCKQYKCHTKLKAQHIPRSVGMVLKIDPQGTGFPFQVQYLSNDLKILKKSDGFYGVKLRQIEINQICLLYQ